jgi:hypothetical protein
MSHKLKQWVACGAIALIVLGVPCRADTLRLIVQVVDTSWASLPGVAVGMTPVSGCGRGDMPTGPTVARDTDRAGIASFSAAKDGHYRIQVRLRGFHLESTCLRFEPRKSHEPDARIQIHVEDLTGPVTRTARPASYRAGR